MKRILLVYPQYPPATYWGFQHVMRFLGRKASMPPLGLITVAAMLPRDYEVRLVDMNIEPLLDEQIQWADAVFTSTMIVQAPSLETVIERCRRLGVPVVAGGPHPSSTPERIEGVDHIIVGEAEQVLPAFLEDFEKGTAGPIYRAEGLPEVTEAPVPRFDLLRLSAYASMAVQYSRGCPFRCEFCDIWTLFGRRPRTKNSAQFLAELDALEALGWRGNTFIVDDNFIGNPKVVKEFLAELGTWQREHGYPFSVFTEASMNLARDEELLRRMRDAGFDFVFLGIESPSVDSLLEAKKTQNTRSDMLDDIRTIQAHGIEVAGGFIVGFDNDTEDIFDRQIEFIQQAAIPMAMIGILSAIPGTELYKRLEREGRLLHASTGDNTHQFEADFVTRIPPDKLAAGYKRVVKTLYDPTLRNYFRRCRDLLLRLGDNPYSKRKIGWPEIRACLLSIWTIPTRRFGREYLRFLLWSLVPGRGGFAQAVRMGLLGFHFQAITVGSMALSSIRELVAAEEATFRQRLLELGRGALAVPGALGKLHRERRRVLRKLKRRVRGLDRDLRPSGVIEYATFLQRLDGLFAEHDAAPPHIMPSGQDLVAEVQSFFRRDLELFRARYHELRQRAGRGLENLDHGLRRLYRERQLRLRAARRWIRLLPSEYRPLGRLEYAQFVRVLDEVMQTGEATA